MTYLITPPPPPPPPPPPSLSAPAFISGTGLHTILGAGGVIGRDLSRQLHHAHRRVRQVSRQPQQHHPADEGVSADLTDAAATAAAVAGSEVVYLVAGLTYNTPIWQAQWPVVMRNVIDACSRHSARLVFLDNVYAYGRVEGVMLETTPFNPCSRKGEVRAAIATTLLDAMHRKNIDALIVRSADFYGPGATNSFLESVLFARLRTGKAPQWLGNPDAAHTFTFAPDVGRTLAALGQSPTAFGHTWNVPTATRLHGQVVTGRSLSRAACDLAGQACRLQVAPRWIIKAMGCFVPVLRENNEMLYQLENSYRFNSSKTQQALGWQPTLYQSGLGQTMQVAG